MRLWARSVARTAERAPALGALDGLVEGCLYRIVLVGGVHGTAGRMASTARVATMIPQLPIASVAGWSGSGRVCSNVLEGTPLQLDALVSSARGAATGARGATASWTGRLRFVSREFRGCQTKLVNMSRGTVTQVLYEFDWI